MLSLWVITLLIFPATSPCSTSRSRGESSANCASAGFLAATSPCDAECASRAARMAPSRAWSSKGFSMKSTAHRLDRERHIAVAGDQDHRTDRAPALELPEKLDAGHTDIGDHATRRIDSRVRQEGA